MKHNKIDVIFWDVDAKETFARQVIPVEQLPQSFEAQTILHLGDDDWEVVNARPMTVERYTETGSLILELRKRRMDYVSLEQAQKNILYSQPTICKEIPKIAIGSSKLGKNVLELDEDEWRQIELLSPVYKETIVAQLLGIQRIFKEQSDAGGSVMGFKEIYLREGISNPLNQAIHPNDIISYAKQNPMIYEGLAYEKVAGLLQGGFAFNTGNLDFYGTLKDYKITALCIHGRIRDFSIEESTFLHDIMTKFDLYIVDWRRLVSLSPSLSRVENYLQQVVDSIKKVEMDIEKHYSPPPHVQLLNHLMKAESAEKQNRLLNENESLISEELVQMIDQALDRDKGQGQEELNGRLQSIKTLIQARL
ncbi:MAG: hypothetical protein GY805_11460 [Chloroflexi bacterium]|nr:hypothetical protein [Chloroflexota bacterium]